MAKAPPSGCTPLASGATNTGGAGAWSVTAVVGRSRAPPFERPIFVHRGCAEVEAFGDRVATEALRPGGANGTDLRLADFFRHGVLLLSIQSVVAAFFGGQGAGDHRRVRQVSGRDPPRPGLSAIHRIALLLHSLAPTPGE